MEDALNEKKTEGQLPRTLAKFTLLACFVGAIFIAFFALVLDLHQPTVLLLLGFLGLIITLIFGIWVISSLFRYFREHAANRREKEAKEDIPEIV